MRGQMKRQWIKDKTLIEKYSGNEDNERGTKGLFWWQKSYVTSGAKRYIQEEQRAIELYLDPYRYLILSRKV